MQNTTMNQLRELAKHGSVAAHNAVAKFDYAETVWYVQGHWSGDIEDLRADSDTEELADELEDSFGMEPADVWDASVYYEGRGKLLGGRFLHTFTLSAGGPGCYVELVTQGQYLASARMTATDMNSTYLVALKRDEGLAQLCASHIGVYA